MQCLHYAQILQNMRTYEYIAFLECKIFLHHIKNSSPASYPINTGFFQDGKEEEEEEVDG